MGEIKNSGYKIQPGEDNPMMRLVSWDLTKVNTKFNQGLLLNALKGNPNTS